MNISVSQRLLEWYDPHLRDLPWKFTIDPYCIWLSEIILQQTRVEQGKPYYLKFVEKYPEVSLLANAPLDEILKLWEGLGYYSRARNLHAAANQIMQDFNGSFPTEYKSLLKLKGVGSYTAAAIASFAYGEPVAVLDGNVYRFLSRLFGESIPIDTSEGKKRFTELAGNVLDHYGPGTHNQAIMDFGATMCTPMNPSCASCPFRGDCVALDKDMIKILPCKSKKTKKRDRFFNFYVITDLKSVFIEKRTSKDVWKGLHQFPVTEHEHSLNGAVFDTFRDNDSPVPLSGAQSIEVQGTYRQVLSHQNIEAQFTEVRLGDINEVDSPEGWRSVPVGEFHMFAYPGIIHSYLSELPFWLPEINPL
ncbi:MAG: A/G-specific adenine glycosylase [Bacteroidetes bacterium]|nr:A/G-specific adenine glycosylase [Bacteroidota bacterium]